MTRGRFNTLEGGEGAGKSTQARRLAEALRADGREVVLTREPGGSPGAETLREVLVNGAADRWTPTAEALLMYAARSDHLDRLIRPALARGAWVISDRFADSSRAYQGAAGGLDPDFIEALDRGVVGADQPDLTLIFDLAASAGLARAAGRGAAEARFEGKGAAFHERLREGFAAIAKAHPERCVMIDADATPDAVFGRIWSVVRERLA